MLTAEIAENAEFAETNKSGTPSRFSSPRRPPRSLRFVLLAVFLASCGGTGGMFGGERETDLWKVDIDAAAGGDGRTWATAFQHPQDAVDAARWGDEIWVAEGTYTRRSPSDTVLLTMKEGVSLYGGFAGTETRCTERDWTTHATMLDGESLVCHVVTGASDATLDGFELVGGEADGSLPEGGGMRNHWVANLKVANCTFSGSHALSGGGVYNSCSSLAVTNCTFSGNGAYYGGGMYNLSSSPAITNCTFSGNTSYFGGGMYNLSSSPTVTDCTFSGNTGDDGGGMYNSSSSPTVTNCAFSGNEASPGRGGGIYNSDSSSCIADCVFSDNSAGQYGGGMYDWQSHPTITDCTFSGNTSDDGGGLFNLFSSPAVADCIFSGNMARDGGGGMCNGSSSPTVTNCIFRGNSTYYLGVGGGMYNNGSDPTLTNCTFSGNTGYYGGGMRNSSAFPTVTNCTFSGNAALYGGAMYNRDSSPTVTNCILWSDSAPTGPEVYSGGVGSPAVNYSAVQGCGGSGAGWDPSIGADGGGNIDSDPLFVNVPLRTGLTEADGTTTTIESTDAATDYVVGDVIEIEDDGVARTVSDVTGTTVTFAPALGAASVAWRLVRNWGPGATDLDVDLHLSSASPCIDAGTDAGAPDHDLDGNPRPSGSYYDMGAYEYW